MPSLFQKFDLDENTGCWNWKDRRNRQGYGHVRVGNRIENAHRVSLRLSKERYSIDLLALHHCDNPSCVNPAHLYWGTKRDNSQDSVIRKRHTNNRKTHCSKGHPLNGENLYSYRRLSTGIMRRDCKICRSDAAARHKEKSVA